MEQKINELLAELDENTLRVLPCFTEQAKDIDDINFRIGLKSSPPEISFRGETKGMYYLTIINEKGETYSYPIQKGDDKFMKCQGITAIIYRLNQDDEYRKMVNEKIGILLTNLKSHFDPVFKWLENYNRAKKENSN